MDSAWSGSTDHAVSGLLKIEKNGNQRELAISSNGETLLCFFLLRIDIVTFSKEK